MRKAPSEQAPADLAKATVAAIANQVYTGSALTPAVTVTADGKTLIYAKISENIYEVPDGTEVISNGALDAVSGTICIPASVTKIEEVYGLGRKKIVIRTPKGSYAEQYAKEHGIRAELTVDGVVVEEWDPPTPNETSGWYSFDMDSDDCPF